MCRRRERHREFKSKVKKREEGEKGSSHFYTFCSSSRAVLLRITKSIPSTATFSLQRCRRFRRAGERKGRKEVDKQWFRLSISVVFFVYSASRCPYSSILNDFMTIERWLSITRFSQTPRGLVWVQSFSSLFTLLFLSLPSLYTN